MPARRSASSRTCSAVRSRVPSRSGTRTKSFSVPCPLVKWRRRCQPSPSLCRPRRPDATRPRAAPLEPGRPAARSGVEPGDPRVGAEPRLLPPGEPPGAQRRCRRRPRAALMPAVEVAPAPGVAERPGARCGPRAARRRPGGRPRPAGRRPTCVHPRGDPLVQVAAGARAGRPAPWAAGARGSGRVARERPPGQLDHLEGPHDPAAVVGLDRARRPAGPARRSRSQAARRRPRPSSRCLQRRPYRGVGRRDLEPVERRRARRARSRRPARARVRAPGSRLDVGPGLAAGTRRRWPPAVTSRTSSWWCGMPAARSGGTLAVPMSIPR